MPYILTDETAQKLDKFLNSDQGRTVVKQDVGTPAVMSRQSFQWVNITDNTPVDTTANAYLSETYYEGVIQSYNVSAEDWTDYATVYVRSAVASGTLSETRYFCQGVGPLEIDGVERPLFMPISNPASGSDTITIVTCARLEST